MRIGQARLVIALSFVLFASSPPAQAQQPAKVAQVGILSEETPSPGTSFELIADGLRRLGWVESQNIGFDRLYAEGKPEVLAGLAAELVRTQPDVILAVGTAAARAAKNATETIPIVFARVGDPIGSGLVPSLARPGGNLMGLSIMSMEIDAKRLELLNLAVPDIKRVGVLWDPTFLPAGSEFKEIERAAQALNLELVPVEVRARDDFRSALQALLEKHAGALIVLPADIFTEHAQAFAELATNTRLPEMFYRRELAVAGGLMSFGTSFSDMYLRAAVYVDKILRGTKPAELPVEQPTKFELVINLKTAKALGLTIPPFLLGRADEVIE
jgi:putative tryptophan/tyrosine transport system substrate-binding protein